MNEIELAISKALSEGFGSKKGIICLGLSAGIDSTVLLHGLAQSVSQKEQHIKAIHVHHGLSVNADAWALQAQTLCAELSRKFSITIDCVIAKVQLDDRSDGLEQAARAARYQVFATHCGPNDVLLQGHHLDDQIETFFMRAIRGSGLTGLASIPKQRPLSRTNSCQILRPLLSIEKNQLLEYAKQHQLHWLEDESNQDSKIDRNWWRNELLPQIWQRYPKKKYSLARTINTIQHEQNLLQQLIINKIASKNELQPRIDNTHGALKDIPRFDLLLIQALDQATSLSYLRAWLAQFVDVLPSAIQMQSIYVDMMQARVDSEPKISWSSSTLYRYRSCLYLIDSNAFNAARLNGVKPNDLVNNVLNDKAITWQGEDLKCFLGQLVCYEQEASFGLIPAQYSVRNWQAGDVAKPAGRSTRKMKKWWQDYNVPSWVREHWPIIVNKATNEIAAVPGLFVCQGYCVQQDQTGWLVEYKVDLT